MKQRIERVFILLAEESEDYTMAPKAVVIRWNNGQFRVYSTHSDHNRFRTLLNRMAWSELAQGVRLKDSEYRLQDAGLETESEGWTDASAIPHILKTLRSLYDRQLFFLDKHMTPMP